MNWHNLEVTNFGKLEREFCSLCMEDDYCSHEIKIEVLDELKQKLKSLSK